MSVNCRSTVTEVYQGSSGGSAPAAGHWGCETAATSKYLGEFRRRAEDVRAALRDRRLGRNFRHVGSDAEFKSEPLDPQWHGLVGGR